MQCRNLYSPLGPCKVVRMPVLHADYEPFYRLSFTSQTAPLSTFFLIYCYITRQMAASIFLAKMFLTGATKYTLTRSAEFYGIRSLFTTITIGKMLRTKEWVQLILEHSVQANAPNSIT